MNVIENVTHVSFVLVSKRTIGEGIISKAMSMPLKNFYKGIFSVIRAECLKYVHLLEVNILK
jgi:hypothetical protein